MALEMPNPTRANGGAAITGGNSADFTNNIARNKPLVNLPSADQLPSELISLAQWLSWKAIPQGDGRIKKMPICPSTGKAGSSTNPMTWGSFEDARRRSEVSCLEGVGFVFTPEDRYCGIDLDDCRNPKTGTIEMWAWEIIQEFDTYTEISPSGKGMKLFLIGKLPGPGLHAGNIEMYDRGRFFTVTGQCLQGTPLDISLADTKVKALYAELATQARANGSNGHKPSVSIAQRIPDGQRHNELLSIAGRFRRYGMELEEIDAALQAINESRCDPPGSPDSVRKIAESICGCYEPAYKSDGTPSDYGFTETVNAERFAARHGKDVHYCYQLDKWYAWDGQRWRIDDFGEIERRTKETARGWYLDAAKESDDARRKAIIEHARRSESEKGRRAMVNLARSEPGIAVHLKAFNADPFLLNVLNGTVDLRTGELHLHRQEDLITKLAPVIYDPAAKFDLWEELLDSITNHNVEFRAFLKRASGYSCTGDTGEEKLFMPLGPSATGKSTFLEALKATLGDYAATADFETFLI